MTSMPSWSGSLCPAVACPPPPALCGVLFVCFIPPFRPLCPLPLLPRMCHTFLSTHGVGPEPLGVMLCYARPGSGVCRCPSVRVMRVMAGSSLLSFLFDYNYNYYYCGTHAQHAQVGPQRRRPYAKVRTNARAARTHVRAKPRVRRESGLHTYTVDGGAVQ